MCNRQPKKLLIVNILNVLKKYSDENHPLTQTEIADFLKEDYNVTPDRKAIKRNLMDLLDSDNHIECTKNKRIKENGEEELIFSNWYYSHDFSSSELRLLIDSISFSKTIPASQGRELINKIGNLSGIYFKNKNSNITFLSENTAENKQIFYTIDVLDNAISENKKVSLMYNYYGTDKKLHPKKKENYIINPYRMVNANGRYYVICNVDKYNDLAYFRIDKITDVKILSEAKKPASLLEDGENLNNLPSHMAEHIYMFSGKSIHAKFRTEKNLMDQVIDWFGKDIHIINEDDKNCIVSVHVNEDAFFYWAIQYGLHVEVISPESMRERLKASFEIIREKYRD